MGRKALSLILFLVMVFFMMGCNTDGERNSAQDVIVGDEVEELNLSIGVAPGPASYPLVLLAEENPGIELKTWQNMAQLTSMVTTKEIQICASPISNALLTYNKGFDVQLSMVTVWGMLYVMSTDASLSSLQDLKGEEIVISGQGNINDLIFRHLLIENGMDPDTDLTITYMDMPEASSRLVTGDLKHAVLNEPHSSVVTLNAQKSNIDLFRVLDLTEEWNKLPGQEDIRLPMAGIVVVKDEKLTAEEYENFEVQYFAACERVNSNPKEVGSIVEKYIPWMKATAVAESTKYARLRPQKATECQAEIEAFFQELSKTNDVKAFGGKLPDAGFYYQGR